MRSRSPLSTIDVSTPVVVLRSGRAAFPQHGALGVIRSLGRLGVRVAFAGAADGGIAASSRYVRDRVTWTPTAPDDTAWLEPLLRLGARLPRAVLVPTDDLSAVFTDGHADELSRCFTLPRSPSGVVARLVDKQGLAQACRDADVATPEITVVRDPEGVDAFLVDASFPVVVKSDMATIVAGISPSVAIVRSPRDLHVAVARARGADVLVQELIAGGPGEANWIFNGHVDRAACLFKATGRKTGQYPVDSGMATAVVTDRNDEVSSVVLRLLGHVGYVGPVDVDLRFDVRDGRYKVVDVNPRIGGSFRAFVTPDGMDTIRATYLALTGQDVPASSVRDGRTWVVETHVLASAVAYRRDGWAAAGRWLTSLARVDEGALFGGDDPRPMIGAAGHAVRRIGGRLVGDGA